MAEDFPKLVKDVNLQIQHTPTGLNPNKSMPRYITINPLKAKDKGKILKGAREKQYITYGRTPNQMTADFSFETTTIQWK